MAVEVGIGVCTKCTAEHTKRQGTFSKVGGGRGPPTTVYWASVLVLKTAMGTEVVRRPTPLHLVKLAVGVEEYAKRQGTFQKHIFILILVSSYIEAGHIFICKEAGKIFIFTFYIYYYFHLSR